MKKTIQTKIEASLKQAFITESINIQVIQYNAVRDTFSQGNVYLASLS